MNIKERFYVLPRGVLQVLFRQNIKSAYQFLRDYFILRDTLKDKLAAVIDEYRIANPGIHYQKYLDVDFWVFEALRRVYFLELNRSASKKILDLGTGAGYFPFICKFYGHEAEGLDVPDNSLYNIIISTIGVKRHEQYIHSGEVLKLNEKYDMITAFMICFNNHKTAKLWHIQEWDFFLNNLYKDHLKIGGRVFLSFNPESDDMPIHKELVDYFIKNGGSVKGQEVDIRYTKIVDFNPSLSKSSYNF